MRYYTILVTAMIFSLIFLQNAQATWTYYSVGADVGDASHTTIPPPIAPFAPITCSHTFTEYASIGANTFPYTASFQWYSPDNTLLLNFPAEYYSNLSCLLIGSQTTSNRRNNSLTYESKTTMTTSAITHNTWVLDTYTCSNPPNNTLIIANNGSIKDYYGNYLWGYTTQYSCAGFGGCSLPSESVMLNGVIDRINNFYYGMKNTPKTCPTGQSVTNSYEGSTGQTIGTAGQIKLASWFIVPFYNYYASQVNISVLEITNYFSNLAGCSGTPNIYTIYDYDTVANTTTLLSSTAPYNGQLTLSRNREHMLFIKKECWGSRGDLGFAIYGNYSNYNISINTYQPTLNCTAWGACVSNQQTRYCEDLNHLIDPFIDQRSCFSYAQISYFLGFDTYTSTKSWYCTQGAGFFLFPVSLTGCARDPLLRDRKTPSGWLRGGQFITDTYGNSGWIEDYIDVSESIYYTPDAGGIETSLKMWYLPRKTYLPVWNATGDNRVWCNETMEGQVGSVYKDINNTFWIAKNVTAFSPYMSLSYRVRNCKNDVSSPEKQTSGGFSCWAGCQWFGTCANIGVCNSTGEDIYTWNGCPETPKASLGIRVKDLDAGTYPLQIVIPDDKIPASFPTDPSVGTGYQEHRLNNLTFNHTYEITFAVPPPNGLQEKDAYCVYLDDVNINFRNEPFICGGSQCYDDYDVNGINDYTFVQVTPLSSNSCTIETTCMDTACVPNKLVTDVQQMLLGNKNYTCDGTTYITINPTTRGCSYLPDNAICIAQQAQEQAGANMTTMNDYLCSLVNSSGFDACAVAQSAGFSFAFSTIFIVFLIDLLIGSFLAYKIKTWEVLPIALIGLMLIETIFGVFPAWFAILFGVFLALFLAEFIMRRYKGG